MNISHNQRRFRNMAEHQGRLFRRNRVKDCFAVKTNKGKLALLGIEDTNCKCIAIQDLTRERGRLIGRNSYLYKEPRYNGPGGFHVIFHQNEAETVYQWVLDTIETNARPPVGLFDSRERVKGLPAYLMTRLAEKAHQDAEYRLKDRRYSDD